VLAAIDDFGARGNRGIGNHSLGNCHFLIHLWVPRACGAAAFYPYAFTICDYPRRARCDPIPREKAGDEQ
jgi:hypothetical protein